MIHTSHNLFAQIGGMPGMGWQFILAVLVLIILGLFLIGFPLTKIIRARKRKLSIPWWLWGWFAGIALGIITLLLIHSLKPSFFIRVLYWYWSGWPPYLPISALLPLGMVLNFDLATILGSLLAVIIFYVAGLKKTKQAL
jgi:hypothetical protein